MKTKHRQKAERLVQKINEAQRELTLANKKLENYWTFNKSQWELLREQAYSRRERAHLKLVQMVQRDRQGFDCRILAELDDEWRARAVYSDAFPMWEMGPRDFTEDVYGE